MPDHQFDLMRRILAAPSPVGLEGAMTHGVLEPHFAEIAPDWKVHRFRGNAGIVVDTAPDEPERLTVMIVGHADKIRLQVRRIGDDGKIWINSDSFLPQTLLGHQVILFARHPDDRAKWRSIRGGTVEAVGAIHFADAAMRNGDKGIKKDMLYLELQIHGEKKREQVERLGIRPGDPIILDRQIRPGFSPDTFYGAYLDNGLGCFVAAEVARLISERGGLKNIRVLFAFAAHEEIGRLGSRVLAGTLEPDIVIAADVSHDYVAAPGIGDRRLPKIAMGEGFSLQSGSIVSEYLNTIIECAAAREGIAVQKTVSGRDTGTDAMAGAFAAIDAAATSVGFPIRNMHTISECGHTGDVLSAIHALDFALQDMDSAHDGAGLSAEDFRQQHPRLDETTPAVHVPGVDEDEDEEES